MIPHMYVRTRIQSLRTVSVSIIAITITINSAHIVLPYMRPRISNTMEQDIGENA